MKAYVDPELCISCGLCAEMCPDVFKMQEDNMAKAIEGPVPSELEASCREAASACPVDAIRVD